MLIFNRLLAVLAGGDRLGATLCRIAVGVVFIWIGLLKFIPYEADSITPFVANSPFMSFFYEHPDQYRQHLNHEGELVPENRAWHEQNNTYGYSHGLGVVELVFASNTPIDDIVAAVNSRKSVTGLSASRQTAGNATSGPGSRPSARR